MSEDDRAAKAARAKALLKKRQQKKGGVQSATAPIESPPASRSFTPTPVEQASLEDEKRDFGDVFSKSDSDTSWVNLLPRVGSPTPSATASPPPAFVKSPPLSTASDLQPSISTPLGDAKEDLLQNLERTVSSLTSEKAALVADLERLRVVELKVLDTEALLGAERSKSQLLDDHVRQLQEEKDSLSGNQQQTISLLVSEKASLSAELERLEDVETKARETESLLERERARLQTLNTEVRQLEASAEALNIKLQQSQSNEKVLSDKNREQERQLQLANAQVNDLRTAAERHQNKVRELQEQIQNDDRVERLENSLKNTQDRADEHEFQLSKLKQAHTSMKSEREEIESQLRIHLDGVSEWKTKYSEVNEHYSAAQQELRLVVGERDTLLTEISNLRSQEESTKEAFKQLQERLTQSVSDLTINTRQLQDAQVALRTANRRADEAEKAQKNLQAEGTNLMRSLDEMRPKIVELTGVKLELSEKIDGLEYGLRSRDATIAQLELAVQEIREQKDDADQRLQEVLSAQEKERLSAQDNSAELQKAYSDLQSELDSSQSNMMTLEAERTKHHQEASRWVEEIDRLKLSNRAQREDISSLRRELEERTSAQEEEEDFLERAQYEIETLRADVLAKEEEIQRLRETVSSSDSPQHDARSLDDELLSTLKQQHALDLSAAQSQIRALETSVFDAQGKTHALQKHVNLLEDELTQLRAASRLAQRSFSPGIPSRPSSRVSLSSHRPSNLAPPLARSVFEQNLTPETRHKRRISLSMLKARIESETVAASSHPPSRAVTPVPSNVTQVSSKVREPASRSSLSLVRQSSHRPQFLDESHVFWCHSCRGDLVVL